MIAAGIALFPVTLTRRAVDTSKNKKQREKEKQESLAKAEADKNLGVLREIIGKHRVETQVQERKKLDEFNKPKPVRELPVEKRSEEKISLELQEIVKKLLDYEKNEVPTSEEAFAKAVNTIVLSEDKQEQERNFWIMLDPIHSNTLQRFLINLAGSNIEDK